jgi:hypothetical protein
LHHQLITYRSIIGAIFPNLLDVIILPVPKGATCTISLHKAMTRVQQGKNESPQNETTMDQTITDLVVGETVEDLPQAPGLP